MKKILFIDDDEILLDTFSTILEKNGFDVTAIRDGICLDSLINIDQFDVIGSLQQRWAKCSFSQQYRWLRHFWRIHINRNGNDI